MNRQTFLRWSALGVGGALLSDLLWSCRSTSNPPNGGDIDQQTDRPDAVQTQESVAGSDVFDFIIIGAGLAGLAAAAQLRALGSKKRFVVLEARDRIGGRVWSLRPDGDSGPALDMGASWIHGPKSDGRVLAELVAQANAARPGWLPTVATDIESSTVYRPTGHQVLQEDDRFDRLFDRLYNQLDQQAKTQSEAMTLRSALDALLAQPSFPKDYASRLAIEYKINSNITQEYAADPADLSARFWDEGSETQGENDLLFPRGYDRLATWLVESQISPNQRQGPIRLGHVVKRIRYNTEGVVVETDQGVFRAKAAIVTLPLGVLKAGRVQFEPELAQAAPAKARAIDALGMGVLNKAFLTFPEVFWANTDWLGYISDPPGLWSDWLNLTKAIRPVFPDAPAILVGFNGGRQARDLEALNDDQLKTDALATLDQMYAGLPPANQVKLTASRWASDPYALGSYSYLAVGAKPSDRRNLAAPIGDRLFFAGEATSTNNPATVHGAYQSGLAAAKAADRAVFGRSTQP